MRSIGTVKIDNEQYFILLNDVKATESFYLINSLSKDDIQRVERGEAPLKPFIKTVQALPRHCDESYVLEAVSRTKVSGNVKFYGNCDRLNRILAALAVAKAYAFKAEDIHYSKTFMSNGILMSTFSASDNNIRFSFEMSNGLQAAITLVYNGIELYINNTTQTLSFKKLDMREAPKALRKQILISSIKNVTYEMLKDVLDMSWYEDETGVKKNYRSIKSIYEFEEFVIKPLMLEIQKYRARGEVLDIALDTETTGLNVYNLSEDNPDKDHCVAIPLSWEDDQGVVIFTDMEHFGNVPNSYAWRRLAPLLTEDTTELIDFKTRTIIKKQEIEKLTAFSDLESIENKDSMKNYDIVGSDIFQFHRSDINLDGHNVMFDGRVGLDNGVPIYWNDDSLQMAFDLNPTTIKGSKKLKIITRKLFGHETPELETILGKGNEDKYRYLTDEQVAIIYGCADADYTRKCKKVLRSFMSDELYRQYRMQDMTMLNILYRSEYLGMMTIQEEVIKLAKQVEQDLNKLKEFLYFYVGRHVAYSEQMNMLNAKLSSGQISEWEYDDLVKNIEIPKNARYEFELKGSAIRTVLYSILKYPILGFTKGKEGSTVKQPSVDKNVMKKLLKEERSENDSGFKLTKSIISCSYSEEDYAEAVKNKNKKALEEMELVSAKKFNSKKYPVALVLQKYAELNKEYTSYYKPILEGNLEGKLYKNYSLSRIETRRIMNPLQTIKGNLKRLVRSYSDEYYLLDWDMSQVEYRCMASLAGHLPIITKMKNPENDYHVETAAMLNQIAPYLVTKIQRKKAKNVSFGKPYGLGLRSLCETMFGVVNEYNLTMTRLIIKQWEDANGPIVDFLEKKRDEALVPVECSDEFRTFIDMWEMKIDPITGKKTSEYKLDENGNRIPIPFGKVTNEKGFYRIFDLSNLDDRKIAKIRRMAGNYPIQSFAAELFRMVLIRFYNRCKKEGIADKILWHMLIHDELLASVHKSIHPLQLYKILYEECMVKIKGHTNYFIGINIGDTWADCKNDYREAPVLFVKRMVERWDQGEFDKTAPENPSDFVMQYRKQYIRDRIGEIVHSLQPDVDTAPVNLRGFLDNFTNYTVRAYVGDYYKPNYAVPEPENSNSTSQVAEYEQALWNSKFESWMIDYFGQGKELIPVTGEKHKVYSSNLGIEVSVVEEEKYANEEEDEPVMLESEEAYWTFDNEELVDTYNAVTYVVDDDDYEEEEEFEFNKDSKAEGLGQFLVLKKTYKNLLLSNNRLIITVPGIAQLNKCKKFLEPKVYATGLKVTFKVAGMVQTWVSVDSALDLNDLDQRLEEWKQ